MRSASQRSASQRSASQRSASQRSTNQCSASLRPCAIVMEGDSGVRRAIESWLEPELEVQAAGCAHDAAGLIERMGHVDLAFLDLDLPHDLQPGGPPALGGDELLERLQRWPDAIRVLLVSELGASMRLPRQRHLAHLLLAKPPASWVVLALKRATLRLPRI